MEARAGGNERIFMKIMLMTVFVLALCGCERKSESDFEFHSGSDGQVMWQCNRKTGEVKTFTAYTASFECQHSLSRDFILNRNTGQVWRYYQNDSNSIPDEGFAPLNYGLPVARPKPFIAQPNVFDTISTN